VPRNNEPPNKTRRCNARLVLHWAQIRPSQCSSSSTSVAWLGACNYRSSRVATWSPSPTPKAISHY